MQEIYLYENNGQVKIVPVTDEMDLDPYLLQAAEEDSFDSLVPLFAGGDSDLAYMTAYRLPSGQGGMVVVHADGDDPMFCVIARSNLELFAAASYFSSMVSDIRYGMDIFENIAEED